MDGEEFERKRVTFVGIVFRLVRDQPDKQYAAFLLLFEFVMASTRVPISKIMDTHLRVYLADVIFDYGNDLSDREQIEMDMVEFVGLAADGDPIILHILSEDISLRLI